MHQKYGEGEAKSQQVEIVLPQTGKRHTFGRIADAGC
jgi:hypothetical protein